MIEYSECLRKARECQQLASECSASLNGTQAATLQSHFLQLAEGWCLLAQQSVAVGTDPHAARTR